MFKMHDFKVERDALANCDMSDIAGNTVKQMAKDTQRMKDEIIKQVISAHLGRTNWELSELEGRCECKVAADAHPDKRTETFSVDGVDLITFFPQKVTTANNGHSVNMHVEIKYQLHIACEIDLSGLDKSNQ
ncbi:hypothetical protein [Arsukibacterium indicum]|uniref:Uncharacterized protein n=1 Tax=Arsukibacterium indicum TaxID=2848612 RepID=A0ABS6MHB1_9GAMM|nr:hypothetical protein [Arsukibacterium indicum]MBV2128174.1 hypothetical protein [Arsukibacterium indicum]